MKQRQKQNRILAKNVAEWVDQAMTINSSLMEQKESNEGEGDMVVEDLNMDDFNDNDEDEDEDEDEKVQHTCGGKSSLFLYICKLTIYITDDRV